ncbi:MAG: BatA domain-containing protein [Planctomycetes bacterium]|nr:BatA domain-containing protein [Planctomycetota bacterium]
MPSFPPGAIWFAVAGVLAASVPIILHLINRRRVKVIHWAAMDFLRESVQRSRRLMKLRDLLLMILRAAAFVLLGLALAQPYFASRSGKLAAHQPLHAVLLMDNSLSMGYEQVGGTLLDEAKRRAKGYIDQLPEGSRISIVPLCGNPTGYRLEPYASKDDAREALDAIALVDRSATSSDVASLAQEACQSGPKDMSQRLVLFGDQQAGNWPAGAGAQWKQLPELQAVRIGPAVRENAWVAEFRPQDAVANVEAPTLFRAVVQYTGQEPRRNVEVALTVDGKQVDSRTIDLTPGQRAPLDFEYTFKHQVEPGKPLDVPVSVTLTPDHLPADDARHWVMPVVAALPVVFVDQLGSQERPREGIVGETYLLRRLLAPITSRTQQQKQLIKVRHLALADVTPEKLADARMVIVAGIKDPAGAVDVLRQYVDQGGQLVLAAGGRFDPAAWNKAAWRDGEGILPLPLSPVPVGETLNEAAAMVNPLHLNVDQMANNFYPPQMSLEELRPIYAKPMFFKVVKVQADDEIRQQLVKDEAKRLTERLTAVIAEEKVKKSSAESEKPAPKDAKERDARDLEAARRAELRPTWLTWQNPRQADPLAQRPGNDETVEKLAARLAENTKPETTALFDNGLPWIVERNVGRGHITMLASGVYGDWAAGWNTLGLGADALLYDRLLRGRLESTLPERNLEARDEFNLPIAASDRRKHFTLTRPGGEKVELEPRFLDASTIGLSCGEMLKRGVYTIVASTTGSAANTGAVASEQIPLSINGPATESDLKQVSDGEFKERMEGSTAALLGPDQEISLQGTQVYGHWLWKVLLIGVILALLAERLVVARSASQRAAADASGKEAAV